MKETDEGLKVAGVLHSHTTNSDGSLRPKELVSLYRAMGFDFLAITDHDYITEISMDLDDFIILKGFEESSKMHINHIEDKWNEAGLCFLNHPNRYNLSKMDIMYVMKRYNLVGVEKYNRGREHYLGHLDCIELSNDDFHNRGMQGKSWNEVAIESGEFNKDALLNSIMKGNVKPKTGQFTGITDDNTEKEDGHREEDIQVNESREEGKESSKFLEGVPESSGKD